MFEDDQRPTRVKRPRSVGKQMVCSYFSSSGQIATNRFVEQKTITAGLYVTKCLPNLFERSKKNVQREV